MLTMLDRSPYEIYCDDSLEREYPDELHDYLGELHRIIYDDLNNGINVNETLAYLIERDSDTGIMESTLLEKQHTP